MSFQTFRPVLCRGLEQCRAKLLVALVIAVAAVSAPVAAAPDADGSVALVRDGEASAVIVVPEGADEGTDAHAVATRLAGYIEMMSGVALPVTQEHELDASVADNRILVGETNLTRELGVDAAKLGPGGIRVKTIDSAVVLLGGPARVEGRPGSDGGGLHYASIELLEHLGFRYLWPGELGMVIPESSTVIVEPIDVTYTPPILRRGMRGTDPLRALRSRSRLGLEWMGLTHEAFQEGRRRAMGDAPPISWRHWQRLGGNLPRFGHAGSGLRDAERHLEENPEWFALQADGTRDQVGSNRWRLCKSNRDLIEHVANDIIQRRNENPDMSLVSLDPNDGGGSVGWCQCESCKALDPEDAPKTTLLIFPTTENRTSNRERIEHPSLSDRLVYYWNSIAERVTEEHPDLRFGVSAYSRWVHAPVEQRLHPNLMLRYVASDPGHLAGWKDAGLQQVFWRPNILTRRHGKMLSIVGQVAEHTRYFVDAGVVQTDISAVRHHWATRGLNYYAYARLVWNPFIEADELIADFAEHGFGDGAPHIERYIHRLEKLTVAGVTRHPESADDYLYTPATANELRALLNEAEAAADDPTISDRIALLRMGLNITELLDTLDHKDWRAGEGLDIDDERTQQLKGLAYLAMRDIALNHALSVNAASLLRNTAGFNRWRSIGSRARSITPSDESLLERIDNPDYGLTGREQSVDDMLTAFGLDAAATAD